MNEIRNGGRNTSTKPALAELEKQIPQKKTGLAVGNKSLIKGGSKRSALVTNRQPNSYLATNWQRTDAEARFTSRDRRFPTPQPTTTHLFWPNQRREPAWLLPMATKFTCPSPAGAASPRGRSAAAHAAKAPTEKRSRNFMPNKSTPQFA
jgi:hypothetical protein